MLILIGGLFGAVYFGYRGMPLYVAIGWAIFCTVWLLYENKAVLEEAKISVYGENSSSNIGARFTTFLIFIAVATVLSGVQAAVYYIALQFK